MIKKIDKKNKTIKYNFFNNNESRYPILVRISSFLIKIGIIGMCSIFLKLSLIYFNGYKGYYIDLIYHLLMVGSSISFFLLFLIASFVQVKEKKSIGRYLFINGIMFLILAIEFYSFIPMTFKLTRDLSFRNNNEYSSISGNLESYSPNRSFTTFCVKNIEFRTESIPNRDKLNTVKKMQVLYLPNSKYVIEVRKQ